MGYQRYDNGSGNDGRWRDREDREERGRMGRGDWDRDRGGDGDRGFFDRAGDEVRSWFGDDEAERRREMDQRRYQQESGRHYGAYGSGQGRDRDDRGYRDEGRYRSEHGRSGGGLGQPVWEGSGFGGYGGGRRFDRIDAGSTGTQGAHPMSSPSGGGTYGDDYGTSSSGYRSSAREGVAAYGAGGANRGADLHDRHYHEWRNRQMEELDRDYDDYRREHQSRFEQEFGTWRETRRGQRNAMAKVTEHMEVVGSDGQHVGTVDKVKNDRIILTKSDENAGGHHHSIPCGWINTVDDKVTINKTAEEAMRSWRDEETRRALFEREDQGSDGPHALNRSFSGTY